MSVNNLVRDAHLPAQMKKTKSKNTSPSTRKSAQKSQLKRIAAHLISYTPGRLRLRITASDRTQIPLLDKTILAHPEIQAVRSHPHIGSMTILLTNSHRDLEEIKSIFQDLGIIIDQTKEVGKGATKVANNVTGSVLSWNRQIKQSTQGEVDLRVLFPVSLACLSVRQLLIKGLQLDIIPWYVLAWYAFDSFLKLHTSSLPEEG